MLCDAQRRRFREAAPNLHDENLSGEDAAHDHEEQRIIAEVLEHIKILLVEFSAVDAIEHLHHHECMEEYGKVLVAYRIIRRAGRSIRDLEYGRPLE